MVFFWGPDPSSSEYASVGGNLAHNSAGPRSVKYGTTRDNTLGLTAITGDGKRLKAGVYTSKGVVGYDFTRLIIGSEGTLGLITSATLKLTPLPEAKATLRMCFMDIDSATHAIVALMGQPIVPCALEFIDQRCVQLLIDHSTVDLPPNTQAMLIVEIDGASETMAKKVKTIQKTVQSDGLIECLSAQTTEEISALWYSRKALSPLLRNFAPKKVNEDIAVPVGNIPELIQGLEALSERYQIPILNFGHAGNGNIHVNMMYDPDNPTQAQNATPCLNEIFALVLALDGTLSGEHGTGLAKRDYLCQELDDVYLGLMRAVKKQFDPNNLLNPDKIPV